MLSILNNYFFFLFLTTLAVSDNLVLFFIGWVGLNISLYGILLKSFNSYNKEITLKYFISGSIITMFLLFSTLLYFIDYYTFSLSSSSYLFLNTDSVLGSFGSIFSVSKSQKVFYTVLVCSMLFKLGSFPFHFYLADMYQSLNERETMFAYTIALKISIFVTLLKFLTFFWYLNYTIVDTVIYSGFSSMFISSFSMLKQYKLSKLWAYSYLNSIGFTLLALASGISSEFGEISFYSAKVYFFTYLITWFGIVDFLSTFSLRTVNSKISKKLFYVSDLLYLNSYKVLGLSKNNRSFYDGYVLSKNKSFDFVIFISSLFGLPPAIGFFSKALVYFDLASNSQTILILIGVLLLTPLSSFAYLKLIVYSIIDAGKMSSYSKVSGLPILVTNSYNSNYFVNYSFVSKLILILPLVSFIYYI